MTLDTLCSPGDPSPKRFKLAEHATRVSIEGQGILVDTERRVFYRTNSMADWILAHTEAGGVSSEQLTQKLTARFPSQSAEQIAPAISDFFQELCRLGLLVPDLSDTGEVLGPSSLPELTELVLPCIEVEGPVQTVVAQLTARLAALEAKAQQAAALRELRAPLLLYPKTSPLTQFPRTVETDPWQTA